MHADDVAARRITYRTFRVGHQTGSNACAAAVRSCGGCIEGNDSGSNKRCQVGDTEGIDDVHGVRTGWPAE